MIECPYCNSDYQGDIIGKAVLVSHLSEAHFMPTKDILGTMLFTEAKIKACEMLGTEQLPEGWVEKAEAWWDRTYPHTKQSKDMNIPEKVKVIDAYSNAVITSGGALETKASEYEFSNDEGKDLDAFMKRFQEIKDDAISGLAGDTMRDEKTTLDADVDSDLQDNKTGGFPYQEGGEKLGYGQDLGQGAELGYKGESEGEDEPEYDEDQRDGEPDEVEDKLFEEVDDAIEETEKLFNSQDLVDKSLLSESNAFGNYQDPAIQSVQKPMEEHEAALHKAEPFYVNQDIRLGDESEAPVWDQDPIADYDKFSGKILQPTTEDSMDDIELHDELWGNDNTGSAYNNLTKFPLGSEGIHTDDGRLFIDTDYGEKQISDIQGGVATTYDGGVFELTDDEQAEYDQANAMEEFNEQDHPRDDDGKFGSGGGGSGSGEPDKDEKARRSVPLEGVGDGEESPVDKGEPPKISEPYGNPSPKEADDYFSKRMDMDHGFEPSHLGLQEEFNIPEDVAMKLQEDFFKKNDLSLDEDDDDFPEADRKRLSASALGIKTDGDDAPAEDKKWDGNPDTNKFKDTDMKDIIKSVKGGSKDWREWKPEEHREEYAEIEKRNKEIPTPEYPEGYDGSTIFRDDPDAVSKMEKKVEYLTSISDYWKKVQKFPARDYGNMIRSSLGDAKWYSLTNNSQLLNGARKKLEQVKNQGTLTRNTTYKSDSGGKSKPRFYYTEEPKEEKNDGESFKIVTDHIYNSAEIWTDKTESFESAYYNELDTFARESKATEDTIGNCPMCDGLGKITDSDEYPIQTTTCPYCKGTGNAPNPFMNKRKDFWSTKESKASEDGFVDQAKAEHDQNGYTPDGKHVGHYWERNDSYDRFMKLGTAGAGYIDMNCEVCGVSFNQVNG